MMDCNRVSSSRCSTSRRRCSHTFILVRASGSNWDNCLITLALIGSESLYFGRSDSFPVIFVLETLACVFFFLLLSSSCSLARKSLASASAPHVLIVLSSLQLASSSLRNKTSEQSRESTFLLICIFRQISPFFLEKTKRVPLRSIFCPSFVQVESFFQLWFRCQCLVCVAASRTSRTIYRLPDSEIVPPVGYGRRKFFFLCVIPSIFNFQLV